MKGLNMKNKYEMARVASKISKTEALLPQCYNQAVPSRGRKAYHLLKSHLVRLEKEIEDELRGKYRV